MCSYPIESVIVLIDGYFQGGSHQNSVYIWFLSVQDTVSYLLEMFLFQLLFSRFHFSGVFNHATGLTF